MKRFSLLLCALLMLFLFGCADAGANREDGPAAQAAAEAATEASPGAAAEAVTETTPEPAESPEPADLSGTVQTSADEQERIKSLWPLEQIPLSDIGELGSIKLVSFDGGYLLTVCSLSDEPITELHEKFSRFIEGEWLELGSIMMIKDGEEEGHQLFCSLQECDDAAHICFQFETEQRDEEVDAMLQKHWPGDAIGWPEELTGAEPVYLEYGADSGTESFTREWEVSDGDEIFNWFNERYSGAEDYTYESDETYESETITFTSKGLTVKISDVGVYGMVSVAFSAPAATGL